MTRSKICGLTCEVDAQLAASLGADALGFILVEGSARFVGWPANVPPPVPSDAFAARVAVVRDASDASPSWARWFTAVQYYDGDASPLVDAGLRVVRAVRLRDETSLHDVERAARVANAVLVDAYHPDRLGGAGAVCDWSLARRARELCSIPLILAGGLTPDNVAEAIAEVEPYAVDVSSGVEASPGRKDPARVAAFLRAVHEHNARQP